MVMRRDLVVSNFNVKILEKLANEFDRINVTLNVYVFFSVIMIILKKRFK